MRIYLIGFMGSGKTTLGSATANALSVPFIDTDQLVEEHFSLSVSDIFRQHGEPTFREQEAIILRSTNHNTKALIATGGGLPVHHDNMEWLSKNGITMYLQWPEEILIASLVTHRSIRPLLSELSSEEATQKAIQLLRERVSIYERSAITLDMTGVVEADQRLLEKACKYIW